MLGFLFYRKHNFKGQVRAKCQWARVVIDHVRCLHNTSRGIPPGLLRQALQGYAFATFFFGTETWYGPYAPQWALNQIQLIINRTVLPFYKKFPISVFPRETGWESVTVWFDRIMTV